MLKQCLALLSVAIFFMGCESQQKAELIIKNGIIYTGNENQPQVEAVAVIADTIAFAGSLAETEKWMDNQTRVMDLEGKTMTPGLIEGHAHFMGVGSNKLNLDLLSTTSYEEVVSQVAEAAQNAKPGEWITGRGWHQDKWDSLPEMVKGFPTHQALSEAAPDNPVYLQHASGHAALVNAKAMEIAGVSNINQENTTQEVAGGEVIKDALGNPTGIFNENAMGLVSEQIPTGTPERMMQMAQMAMEECLANGITSFHDAGADTKTIDLYKQLAREGKLKTRLYIMISGADTALVKKYLENGPEIGLDNQFLTIRSIKLYADGALGSRGAWLLEEYSDMPGEFGKEVTPMAHIYDISVEALKSGFQVCTHAIGDRANREVLDQYEKAFKQVPDSASDTRFRIEHAQHISAQDIPRFGELGVIPAMQAIHMSSDRPWAIERLGQERIDEGAYVWRKLMNSGATVLNGTDAPVEPISPIASFYASVTRKTLKGEPDGGYEPSQKMSRKEALTAYTLSPAYAAFEENIKGSIERGKLADFTVFSQDIMSVPDEELLNTQVEYTIVGGKLLYEREQ